MRSFGRRSRWGAATALFLIFVPVSACNGQRVVSCESADCAGNGGTGGSGGNGDGGNGGASAGTAGADGCDPSCGGATPVCDGATAECVECLDADDCDDGLCDPETHACVECLEQGDCTEASAARCDAGECVGCAESNHCAGISGKEVCDEPTGSCVECTADDESACGANSCDPATSQCTETERGSRARCRSCVADSECHEDYRCVPMEFQGEPREGGYCLKVGATGCERPFMVPTPARASLSGAEDAVYCGVSESRTTCEAVLDLLADEGCTTPSDCGVPGLDDARCETVNLGLNRCTYACDATNQCPNSFNCGDPPNDYCGAP